MTSHNQIGHRKRKKASKQDKFIHDAVPISKRVAGQSPQMLAASWPRPSTFRFGWTHRLRIIRKRYEGPSTRSSTLTGYSVGTLLGRHYARRDRIDPDRCRCNRARAASGSTAAFHESREECWPW